MQINPEIHPGYPNIGWFQAMKTFDGSPAKPDASLSAKSKDGKTISDADVTASPRPTKNSLSAAVSEVSSFEHKILMSSLNGIYVYDLETGANVFINRQYTRLTGYTLADLQDLKGADFLALFHPEDQGRVAAHLEQIGRADDDETLELEYRFKTADGRWIWCLSRDAVFEHDRQGAVRRIIGIFVDITARKTAEKKSAHERELLQTLIDTIPVMITIYDPGLQHFSFNNEFRRLLGWSEEDLGGGDPMEKLYADPSEREAARQFMASLEAGWRVFKVTTKDGDTVESSWANIRLSNDTQVGIGIDIRERKHFETSLRESRLQAQRRLAELEAIYDSAPIGLCVFDRDSRYLRINDHLAEINGISASDHIGRTIREVVPDLADEAEKIFKRVLDSGRAVLDFELSGATPAQPGVQRSWIEHWLPLKNPGGQVIGVAVTAEETTQQKKAEADLKKARDNLESKVRERTTQLQTTVTALENEMQARSNLENQLRQWSRVFMDAADPIIIENLSGIIIDMNWEAEREYGWQRQELIGKSIRSLIPPARYPWANRLRERCRRGEEVRNWEGMRIDQKGRTFSVLLTAFPLLDESGKIIALATIAKDISLRKQMERELEASQKHLQELSRKSIEALESDRRTTAKELHDGIGASLAAIKFRLEGIAEEIAQTPQQAVASLNETLSYLQDTIKETKQISAKLRPTMLDDLGLLSTISWFTRQFSEQFGNIEVRPHIEIREEDIPETLKIVIYRVLQESLHNAAKHSEAKEVYIGLKTDRHQIVLEVVDNGCGFDVSKTLGRHDPLSGYGLSSMIERAEIVGGSLTIDSSPGEGSHIKMILPQEPYASGILSEKTG
jgi:PAS domain S-box-containing protein